MPGGPILIEVGYLIVIPMTASAALGGRADAPDAGAPDADEVIAARSRALTSFSGTVSAVITARPGSRAHKDRAA